MYQVFEQRISEFARSASPNLFSESQIGLEKESLRVAAQGGVSQTKHPLKLGSALTHPHITTDYSEALLEFVTSPYTSKIELLNFLRDAQTYVYSQLPDDEILWSASMPCVLSGEQSIPIAEYGDSNLGKMKTVYRRGLGHRYGRMMQVIAGVHFNFSFSTAFWNYFQALEKSNEDIQVFISKSYFQLIRNFQRYGWLVPYLFGSSPAVCRSFLGGMTTDMVDFDESTYYYPYATSLRTGDIGYQNKKEDSAGIHVNYNSLDKYIDSLRNAITTPHPDFERLGVIINGRYEQLNTNLLQIENEYYSSVRPKQIADAFEMPISALMKRGVAYIELRSLDINTNHPEGVSEDSLYFLEAFVLFCLLQDSPPISDQEHHGISKNMLDVAHKGRDPQLLLRCGDKNISLRSWGEELFALMQPVCEVLDSQNNDGRYSAALKKYHSYIDDPDCTPSARIIEEMRKSKEGFFHFSLRKSQEHADYFKSRRLTAPQFNFFEQLSRKSIEQQKIIEASDTLSFDEFLKHYFSQTLKSEMNRGV